MTALDRRGQLVAFLDTRGLSVDALLEEASAPFGLPEMVLATGSVIQGYGNARSDIDVYAVVDREDVVAFPIESYLNECRVDVEFYPDDRVRSSVDLARRPWPAVNVTPEEWHARRHALDKTTRFALSDLLTATDTWAAWHRTLQEQWLAEQVVSWWSVEARRRAVAGAWLAQVNARLACQRYCESVLASLEAHAAQAGLVFLTPKWLTEKLRLMGDPAATSLWTQALQATSAVPAPLAVAQSLADEALARFGATDGPRLALRLDWARGTEQHVLDERTLVARWQRRGLVISTRSALPTEGPVWLGTIGDVPPSPVLDLFQEDLLWLTVTAAP